MGTNARMAASPAQIGGIGDAEIGALTAVNDVVRVPVARIEEVCARPPAQDIWPEGAERLVVLRGSDHVLESREHVVPVTAHGAFEPHLDRMRRGYKGDRVVPSPAREHIVTRSATDGVVAPLTADDIGARTAAEHVVALGSDDRAPQRPVTPIRDEGDAWCR
jgi:hypothetical protein